MSWSAHATAVPASQIPDLPVTGGPSNQAMDEQIDVAKEVALRLVESGAVGPSDALYNVALSGHANEGHQITPGWGNDMITVSVSQATPPKAEDA